MALPEWVRITWQTHLLFFPRENTDNRYVCKLFFFCNVLLFSPLIYSQNYRNWNKRNHPLYARYHSITNCILLEQNELPSTNMQCMIGKHLGLACVLSMVLTCYSLGICLTCLKKATLYGRSTPIERFSMLWRMI